MDKGYLMDTNIVIALLANEKEAINFAHQAYQDKQSLYFSVITECEVFTGLKPEEQLKAVKLFSPKRCIDITSPIARTAGILRREQLKKGRKLKTPDSLIIATALENDLALVSRDSDMQFVHEEYGIRLLKP